MFYCFDLLYFFFFKQKTAYEMRISDWSSDVCSSDLPLEQIACGHRADVANAEPEQQPRGVGLPLRLDRGEEIVDRLLLPPLAPEQVRAMRFEAKDVGRALEIGRAHV